MFDSVRLLMERLIDYSGLFPPARLSMDEAIHHYRRYSRDPDSWMLGRFIVPAARLEELVPYRALFTVERALQLSVIGAGSGDGRECLTQLARCLTQIRAFERRFGAAAAVASIELPLPQAAIGAELLEAIANDTAAHGLRAYCEMTYVRDAGWAHNLISALDRVAACNADREAKLGVKLRTGGVAADAFPTPDQAAFVLAACRDREIALKFTAGLHHPVRMFRPEANAKMHGFLNVFAAGMLARAHALDLPGIAEILADEDPEHFRFSAEGLRWKQLFVSSAEMGEYRASALIAYGSCSFDEPRDELRALGLLGQRS